MRRLLSGINGDACLFGLDLRSRLPREQVRLLLSRSLSVRLLADCRLRSLGTVPAYTISLRTPQRKFLHVSQTLCWQFAFLDFRGRFK